jgi:hypothetical protein
LDTIGTISKTSEQITCNRRSTCTLYKLVLVTWKLFCVPLLDHLSICVRGRCFVKCLKNEFLRSMIYRINMIIKSRSSILLLSYCTCGSLCVFSNTAERASYNSGGQSIRAPPETVKLGIARGKKVFRICVVVVMVSLDRNHKPYQKWRQSGVKVFSEWCHIDVRVVMVSLARSHRLCKEWCRSGVRVVSEWC